MDEKESDLNEAEIKVRALALGCSVHNNWNLNSDLDQLRAVYKGLARNLVKHGKAYCPCVVLINMDEKKRSEYVCPCVHAEKQVNDIGHCRCKLFWKKDDGVKNG